jgi:DAACS family dicarboxylate/amino acid:cation (Na+ or H+) symporter
VPSPTSIASHRALFIGVGAGLALGLLANALGSHAPWILWIAERVAHPVGQVFLRLLFMLVIPLVFSALVVGVCDIELRRVGRLGVTMLGYAAALSIIAVSIGMTLVNAFRPGDGLPGSLRDPAVAGAPFPRPEASAASPSAARINMIPDNPIKAAANNEMVGVIVFALVFGIGLSASRTESASRLRSVVEGLYDVMRTLIDLVLRLAPLGVGALLFAAAARLGVELLAQLLAYVGVVLLGLTLHLTVVYSLFLRLLAARSPVAFFRDVRLAMATAFATSSSSATLPTALTVAEDKHGLPRHVSRFVLTAGSAMNQNGTALFEGVTVLFLAQFFGVQLGLGQQAMIMAICILAGIGTAGVPAGSLPVIAMILAMVGIPPEGLGLIVGIDRLLDMCRTTVNVTGDLVIATIVARTEGVDPVHGVCGKCGDNSRNTDESA